MKKKNKKKAGRPRLPIARSKRQLIGIRASLLEETLFKEFAKRDGISLSAWCRKALLFAIRNGIE